MMKKRVLALFLALVMIVGMLPAAALAADASEPALADGYYQIGTEAELKWFRDQVNSGKGSINAKLTKDIALTEDWEPIGNAASYVSFSGTFDGAQHEITGLNIERTASSSVALGLFGLTSAATIKNLVVRGNVSATLENTSWATYEIGGVVGESTRTTMEQVVSYVNVTSVNNSSTASAVGGLFGNGYGATIKNCANYGTISSTDANDEDYNRANVGGLSGMSPYGGTVTIENSFNGGSVSGTNAGGLISVANSGTTVKNSATVGKVTAMADGTFEGCYAETNDVGADGVSIADMKSAEVLTALGSAFKKGSTGLPILAWMTDGPAEPEEPEIPVLTDGYYQIGTETQLKWFRDQVNSGKGSINAKLTKDIALTEDWEPIGQAADYATTWSDNPFKGTFDGAQHEITGLKIERTVSSAVALGLFGSTDHATIKNLIVRGNVSVTLNDASYVTFEIGGVAGKSTGTTMEQVVSYVNVTSVNKGGNASAVGGLFGNGYSAIIKNCANYGTIESTDTNSGANVGGLSGMSVYGGPVTIENSFNGGSVSGTNAGGLISVADSRTTVKNSATVGEVTATADGTFEGCYAETNDVSADGVSIADMKSAEVLTALGSAFKKGSTGLPILAWMTDGGSEAPACDHGESKKKTTAYQPDAEHPGKHTVTVTCECGEVVSTTMEDCVKGADGKCEKCGYVFCVHGEDKEKTTAYQPDAEHPGKHTVTVTCECGEVVSTTTEDCVEGADGKCEKCGYVFPAVNTPELKDGFYQLASEADLKWFRDEVNSGRGAINAKLVSDIVLTAAWTPIGTDSEHKFSGIFDGNHKTISGLRFQVPATTDSNVYLGLFGNVGGASKDALAEIRDLTVTGEIRTQGAAAWSFTVGGVSAFLGRYSKLSGVVSNVAVQIQTAGEYDGDPIHTTVGGLIGTTASSATNIILDSCANLGTVSGEGATGGLVGNHGGAISSSNTYGVEIRNCRNEGSISGGENVGGLVGYIGRNALITDSYNTGRVSGGEAVGGLVGYNLENTVQNCYNTGDISGTKSVGGLAGYHYSGSMACCYSTGAVTGTEDGYTGTLVGWRNGNINVKDDYAVEEPMLGTKSSSIDYIMQNDRIHLVSLEQLRRLPDALNANGSYKHNPGTTPALVWQEVAACTHPAEHQQVVYTQDKDHPGKHIKTTRCMDCFTDFDPVTENCEDSKGSDWVCTKCGYDLCKHENQEKVYSRNPRDDFHTVTIDPCTICGKTVTWTEDCTFAKYEYRMLFAEKYKGQHRKNSVCACGNELDYTFEPCVDENHDDLCDLCGNAMAIAAPTVTEGDGFYDYTIKIGSKDETHYYVSHYEIGETAEELSAVATGKQLSYQWYYRLSEDGTEAGTAVDGATESTFTPDTSSETKMRFYYCVVTNPGGSAMTAAQPVIVCATPTVTAYFSLSDDAAFVVGDNDGGGSGRVLAYQKVTVPYFDLKLYGMENFYFKSETYGPANPGDQMGGSALIAGSSAAAYGKITALHLLIYMLECDYYGLPEEEAGQGYLRDNNLLGNDVFSFSGSVGSILLNTYWNHDMNLNYYLNYAYPLASEGWGSTADQILLRDDDIFSMALFTDWSFFSDENAGFHHLGTAEDPTLVEITATDAAPVELTLYRSYGFGGDYGTDHTPIGGLDLYYVLLDDLYDGDVTGWTPCGTVNEDGTFTLDVDELGLQPGKYLFAVAGQESPNLGSVVSTPGGVLVTVQSVLEKWTVSFTDRLGTTTTQTVKDGKLASAPTAPAHEGYTFLGWFTDEDCKTEYDFSTPVKGNLTLYAGWELVTWTVTFNDRLGTASTQAVKHGECAAEPAAPAHDGYTFLGWFTDEDCKTEYNFSTPVKGNLTLYAGWELVTWTVTFNDRLGTASTQDVKHGECAAEPAAPAHEGYNFLGWFTDEDCKTEYDFSTPVKGNLTLYAGWELVTWTVTFNDRFGSVTTQAVTHGACAAAPADPVHTGYTFRGWFTDENSTVRYDFSTPVTGNLTLYAGWSRIPVTPAPTPSKPNQPAKSDPAVKASFTDVAANAWYADGVAYVCKKGIMNGTSANTFSPNANTTRGMIVTMLARLEGVSTDGSVWYAAGQKWAMDAGISDGTNMTGIITREQLAAILYRYAKLKGYDVSKTASLDSYTDAAQVSAYASDAMRWAVACGLLQGSAGKLSPNAAASRAQVAAILMRFLESYAK